MFASSIARRKRNLVIHTTGVAPTKLVQNLRTRPNQRIGAQCDQGLYPDIPNTFTLIDGFGVTTPHRVPESEAITRNECFGHVASSIGK